MINAEIEVQMAIIDTKMVQIEPVLLPYAIMPDGRIRDERASDPRCVRPRAETTETSPVAQRPPPIEFEDIPLDEARRTSRGPRMIPELDHALKETIQALNTTAARMPLPEATSPTTINNGILCVAAELGIPVTIRRVPGALMFWRSTDADLQQAQQIVARLHSARQPPQANQYGRRRRASRDAPQPVVPQREAMP